MKLIEQLTIIITTSPVKSNPDMSMIKQVLNSFNLIQDLQKCKKLIICDGYKLRDDNQNHYKKGMIDQNQANQYAQFIQNLKDLNIENSQIIQQEKRYGFAKNLLYCIKKTDTQYVMVVQHDQVFQESFDINKIMNVFQTCPEINYIGFVSSCTNNYVNKLIYNNDFLAFSEDAKIIEQQTGIKQFYKNLYKIPIIPMAFWYDKTHVSRKDYYIKLYENKHYNYDTKQYIRIKNFVEDSFGQAYLSQCKREGINAQKKVGCYLYYNENDLNIINHLDGRAYCDEKLLQQYIQMKKK